VDQELAKFRETLGRRFSATFSDCPNFIELFSRETLLAGAHWIRAGELRNDFFFISSGLVRVYYVDLEGNELNEGFYEEGMLVGPVISFVDNTPCPFFIQAMEPATLWVAHYPRFHAFALNKPDILNFEITFMQSLFVSNAKRDAKRLLCTGEQRYLWFCREYSHLLERIPQYQIASFLGMTPVSLSRLRKQLQMVNANRVP
jgi:CRP-like cAMP-binding protein